VAEGLGEAAEQLAAPWVDLLGQQAEVVGVAEEPVTRSVWPARARLSTSQKLQITKLASPPGSPSSDPRYISNTSLHDYLVKYYYQIESGRNPALPPAGSWS
jgi:hypothetical protein